MKSTLMEFYTPKAPASGIQKWANEVFGMKDKQASDFQNHADSWYRIRISF